MIYLELLLSFLKIGSFAFGGAYGAIPLIRDEVLVRGWMDETMFSNIIAVSESTPGPIMVNVATYVGNRQGGIFGAILATFGVVLPSFIIVLLIAASFQSIMQNNKVQATLKGIKPCLIGLILATGIFMAINAVFESANAAAFDWKALLILAALGIATYAYKKRSRKELSPILLIALSAALGGIFYV